MNRSIDSELDDASEQKLWQALRQDGDPESRRRLINHYLGLARQIAASLYRNRPDDTIEFAEYNQYAIVGLIESVDRFRAGGVTAFSTYASYRIRGAVLNGLASASEAREQLAFRSRLRRERMDSLAETEDGEPDLFTQMVELTTGLAIGYLLEDSGLALDPEASDEETLSASYGIGQLKRQLDGVLARLPERDRMIVVYHYFHQVSFETIAEMLEISKGRVSQIHKRVLQTIRSELGASSNLDSFY